MQELNFNQQQRRDAVTVSTANTADHPLEPPSGVFTWPRQWAALGSRVEGVLVFLTIAFIIWLPRGVQIGQFVTVDESKWVVRSANFYEALANRRFEHTFQHGHPGVTIMWAGTLGYLREFPAYPQVAPGQFGWSTNEFDLFIAEHGYEPLQMLVAGRMMIVAIVAVVLGLSFLYARRLFGWWPALVGFGLIAFSPFQISLSRILQPDSLLSPLMLLAALAYLAFAFDGRRRPDLVVSAIVAALTILTKTPGIFLFPLVGLFALIEVLHHSLTTDAHGQRRWRNVMSSRALRRLVTPLLVWTAIVVVVYVLLWPALWVAPRATLLEVMDISGDYAEQGHSSPIFFDGRVVNGDPGFWFYPITYLWRTTPVVLAGLLLALLAIPLRSQLFRKKHLWLSTLGLFCMAFFFIFFMNLGAKKFDRYLLPIYMPLDLLAGLGWAAVALWVYQWTAVGREAHVSDDSPRFIQRVGLPLPLVLSLLVVGAQAVFSLSTFPYYMTFYNPLLGGAAKAPEVMFIGWGEGLDQGARYLNETVNVETTKVASWYPHGPFSYYYDGVTDSNRSFWDADYSVIYAHQWQRELPSRRMLAYFNRLTPEQTITLDGIEFVRIYDMNKERAAPYPDFTVDFGDVIRLVYYDTFSGAMYPGQKFDMTMYFVKLQLMDVNYNIHVRLVNQEGHEFLLHDSWPKGMATRIWHQSEILRDNSYQLEIPEGTPPGLYRIEVSFYNPATIDHLPVTSANTGELLKSPYVLDYLIIGDLDEQPARRIQPVANFDNKVDLFGVDVQDAANKSDEDGFLPGETANLRLYWRGRNYMYTDYTAFVHLLGPNGEVVGQFDRRPLDGFLPTTYWPPRQVIADTHQIQLPTDAPPGEYRVVVGLYDLQTLDRLPITRNGELDGDAIEVATLTVGQP